jgi:hypothetical protein
MEGCFSNLARAIFVPLSKQSGKDYGNQNSLQQISDVLRANSFPELSCIANIGLRNAINHGGVNIAHASGFGTCTIKYTYRSGSKQYYESQSDYSNAIYDFRIEDYTKDINEWQISRMKECMDSEWGGWESFNQNVRQDTTGFFFKSLAAKDGQETDFAADTTIYINYTGRLLNGLVFDTTIERTAKDHGLYKAGNTYEPVKINWGESHGEITMGSSSSSVVSGFSLTLWNMKNLGEGDKMDKAVGIFYSPLGYGYSGSGSGIPGYAPLIFEIEIVAKPE